MACFCLPLVFLIPGLAASILAGSPTQTSNADVGTAKQVVIRFELAFAGKTAKVEPVFADRESNQEYQYSRSSDGGFERVYWDFKSADMKKEGSQADGQLIVASKEEGVDLFHIDGAIDPEYDIVSHFMFVPYLVGFSFDDGVRYSQILNQGATKCSIEDGLLDGQDVSILKATNSVYGSYLFWIGKGESPKLLKIHVTKKRGSRYLESPLKRPMKLGELNSNERKASIAAEIKREKIVYPIEYFENGTNAGVPERVGVRMKSSYANGEKFEAEFHVKAKDVKNFDKDGSDLVLSQIKVWDGLQVNVLGLEGLAFELRDGRIRRVFDSSAIGQIDGVRYRKSNGSRLYFGVLLFCAVTVGAVWLFSKRKES